MLQSSLKEALQDPLNTFSFEEQKKPSESSEISPEIFVFVLVEDLFFFSFLLIIIFQDIDFLWYIASSDNILKTPA